MSDWEQEAAGARSVNPSPREVAGWNQVRTEILDKDGNVLADSQNAGFTANEAWAAKVEMTAAEVAEDARRAAEWVGAFDGSEGQVSSAEQAAGSGPMLGLAGVIVVVCCLGLFAAAGQVGDRVSAVFGPRPVMTEQFSPIPVRLTVTQTALPTLTPTISQLQIRATLTRYFENRLATATPSPKSLDINHH